MNLYIVHYHLFRGGVNRIISRQVESLRNTSFFDNIFILTGRLPEKIHIHGAHILKQKLLYYLVPGDFSLDYKKKAESIYTYFKEKVTKKDIIHIHNPSLGKNPLVTYVMGRLAHEGYPLFYHSHDFAEDRPENYIFLKQVITDILHEDITRVMYPVSRNTIFGVINSFDAERLKSMGIPEDRIKKLPNPVVDPRPPGVSSMETGSLETKTQALEAVCKGFSLDPGLPLMLYPVRVIRRKNIGEYLLLASLFKQKASWMVTMAPRNPVEIKHYKKWKAFAKQVKSPVIFEAGDKMEFPTLMYAATRAVTTSIKEGFGMCFLEPWIFNTPVAGRAVPYVLPDFKKDGMQFPSLYDRLVVTWNKQTNDFPLFPEESQMEIIRKMLADKAFKDDFLAATGIEKKLFNPVPEQIIRYNKSIIEKNYSIEKYGRDLERVYTELSGQNGT